MISFKPLVETRLQMSYKPIMILGTGSHVGKTTIVTALCRHFANMGINVAPFKSQNMSLNSYSTIEGKEIARSTATQAFAAKTAPSVHMNPILLKPENDTRSQVILHGEAVGSIQANEYFSSSWLETKYEAISESLNILKTDYDLIIAEGAGSCAEPNFMESDLVNFGLAELLDANAYIVVNIDKGGAFGEILGTLRIIETLAPQHLKRINGFILNQFRGDQKLLEPAIDFIKRHTTIPIIGVVPFIPDLLIEEEDRIQQTNCENPEIDIAVLYLPHIANASDFNPLSHEEGVRVRFVRSPELLGDPDMIIIPGTKNTAWDLNYIRSIGWEKALDSILATTPIMGICGGFEMLGKEIRDPLCIESDHKNLKGLGYFNFITTFTAKKKVSQVRYHQTKHNPFKTSNEISGYEIHSGKIEFVSRVKPLHFSEEGYEGAIMHNPLIFGTFIHDIFKNCHFTRNLVNTLRSKKKLDELSTPLLDIQYLYDRKYNVLSEQVNMSISIKLENQRQHYEKILH